MPWVLTTLVAYTKYCLPDDKTKTKTNQDLITISQTIRI